jgi:ubiquitin-conjugating enzyme E2 R
MFKIFSKLYGYALLIKLQMLVWLCNRKQVLKTQQEAERDGVKIPLTMEEYCIKSKPKPPEDDMNDFLCDDYADELDSDESDDDDDLVADSQDSGNEES